MGFPLARSLERGWRRPDGVKKQKSQRTSLCLFALLSQAHKSGNKGLSARQKHRLGKEAGPSRPAAKSGVSYAGGKQERHNAAKQQR